MSDPNWPVFLGNATKIGDSNSGYVSIYVETSLGQSGIDNADYLISNSDLVFNRVANSFRSASNKVNVIIRSMYGVTDGRGGAIHNGCDFSIGSDIEICAAFGKPYIVLALFAAELSECFMQGNLCRTSAGEALSRMFAHVTSDIALSEANMLTGPHWASSGYKNFIDAPFGNDTDVDKVGCSLTFLSWLMYKRYTLDHIAESMVALGSDSTLSQLYSKLSGDKPNNAWPFFKKAIDGLSNGVVNDTPFQ